LRRCHGDILERNGWEEGKMSIDYERITPAGMWHLWKTNRATVEQMLYFQRIHGGYFDNKGKFNGRDSQ
jgi:hypothetical protein